APRQPSSAASPSSSSPAPTAARLAARRERRLSASLRELLPSARGRPARSADGSASVLIRAPPASAVVADQRHGRALGRWLGRVALDSAHRDDPAEQKAAAEHREAAAGKARILAQASEQAPCTADRLARTAQRGLRAFLAFERLHAAFEIGLLPEQRVLLVDDRLALDQVRPAVRVAPSARIHVLQPLHVTGNVLFPHLGE